MQLADKSMVTIAPILNCFPLISIHPWLDICSIFRFEPMHGLSVGTSKLLREYQLSLLKQDKKTSLASVTSKVDMRVY